MIHGAVIVGYTNMINKCRASHKAMYIDCGFLHCNNIIDRDYVWVGACQIFIQCMISKVHCQ